MPFHLDLAYAALEFDESGIHTGNRLPSLDAIKLHAHTEQPFHLMQFGCFPELFTEM